ncbi:MAG: class I mannose-6-phosphate isomerase [Chthoniobacterales bacterium]|nr:class I mannose-6-phosphate isomerase [Chthoniobacterales bacterium]
MQLTAPLTFQPILVERPWGGRALETTLHIPLPEKTLIGELWAITDRPEAQSIVAQGPLAGTTLHELWSKSRSEIFGSSHLAHPASSFPILCKLLDASEQLSLQVHPQEKEALLFGGEPKTECWYFLKTAPESSCYAGLKKEVTRENFLQALEEGSLERVIHSFHVQEGESLFIPSGRLHAMGKGILALEVEQNSDTTYRVFDWNRQDALGRPRKLHLKEALASINFEDPEPRAQEASALTVANAPCFHVEKWTLETPRLVSIANNFSIFVCLTGTVSCGRESYQPGDFFLIPAALQNALLVPGTSETESPTLLQVTLPPVS